ncbi:MAG: hypothetical protein EPN43_01590, partial [Jatrophihabitans sp.]
MTDPDGWSPASLYPGQAPVTVSPSHPGTEPPDAISTLLRSPDDDGRAAGGAELGVLWSATTFVGPRRHHPAPEATGARPAPPARPEPAAPA